MTIHLEKLHLATNGKQTSRRVNGVKSLFSLFIRSKRKITESDRNRWNRISVACWWTVTQGREKNTHSLFTLRTSFLFPDGDLSHKATVLSILRPVCMRASVCSSVFSVTRVNENVVVRYSRGEIFSLFAMCDYVKESLKMLWGVFYFF